MESDSFLTILSPTEGIFKDRKSRFISFAFPVTNEDEIKELLKRIKKEYYDAAHHCYAYVLGAERNFFRANDDGEPSNAAGSQILGQINSRQLTNILVVVVRYFGGVKLGVPGLIKAFRTATSDALDKAKIITDFKKKIIEIQFRYSGLNNIMKILKGDGIEIKKKNIEENCRIIVNVRTIIADKILNALEKNDEVKIINVN